MDSFEINKIVAAVLMVALLVIGIGKLSNVIFHVEKPKTPGYAVEVEEATTISSSTEAAVEEKIDIAALMAMGDVTAGEKIFKKCAACHSIVKGGKNKIGPALYNVVERKVGGVEDYKYSKALAAYDKNGKSVQKALMKSPINGARLSSSFGMRKHPIDGYNKMHRGTDFAAPIGTPIMASGNGIVKKAGWCGGGGNCVKIKHNSTYETVYAHMSKFARGIKNGVRVKQGQTIGYVGSTGKSTGPHLHYEVIVNGKKVNSQKLKLPSGKVLKGKNREYFETAKIKLDVLKSEKIIGLN